MEGFPSSTGKSLILRLGDFESGVPSRRVLHVMVHASNSSHMFLGQDMKDSQQNRLPFVKDIGLCCQHGDDDDSVGHRQRSSSGDNSSPALCLPAHHERDPVCLYFRTSGAEQKLRHPGKDPDLPCCVAA